jgi:anti-sigma regulatory factor (Ser/Thr protein kinase)
VTNAQRRRILSVTGDGLAGRASAGACRRSAPCDRDGRAASAHLSGSGACGALKEKDDPGRRADGGGVVVMSGGTGVCAPQQRVGVARAADGGAGAGAGRGPVRPQSPGPVAVPPSWPQGTGVPGDWPLGSHLELGALSSAVPCARMHVRLLLSQWGLCGLSRDAELVVSELATNAVNASKTLPQVPAVRLWLLSDGTQVVILVWDACPRPPVRIDPAATAENGRGLLLVEAVAERWGCYVPEAMGGKLVWALLRAEFAADATFRSVG